MKLRSWQDPGELSVHLHSIAYIKNILSWIPINLLKIKPTHICQPENVSVMTSE